MDTLNIHSVFETPRRRSPVHFVHSRYLQQISLAEKCRVRFFFKFVDKIVEFIVGGLDGKRIGDVVRAVVFRERVFEFVVERFDVVLRPRNRRVDDVDAVDLAKGRLEFDRVLGRRRPQGRIALRTVDEKQVRFLGPVLFQVLDVLDARRHDVGYNAQTFFARLR